MDMQTLTSVKAGRSVNGQFVTAFTTHKSASKYCYLIAGTHGDEPEGVFVQNKLVEWLKSSNVITPFIIIPVLNPDGIQSNTRGNGNGVDLNRNLPASNWEGGDQGDRYFSGTHPLSEPENQYLVSLFDQYPPGFIITFHSWKPMLNSNGDCDAILQLLHKYNAYPIVKNEIEDHPTPGSLGSYASETFGIPILTFECPTLEQRGNMNAIWQENKTGFIELMNSYLINRALNLNQHSTKL